MSWGLGAPQQAVHGGALAPDRTALSHLRPGCSTCRGEAACWGLPKGPLCASTRSLTRNAGGSLPAAAAAAKGADSWRCHPVAAAAAAPPVLAACCSAPAALSTARGRAAAAEGATEARCRSAGPKRERAMAICAFESAGERLERCWGAGFALPPTRRARSAPARMVPWLPPPHPRRRLLFRRLHGHGWACVGYGQARGRLLPPRCCGGRLRDDKRNRKGMRPCPQAWPRELLRSGMLLRLRPRWVSPPRRSPCAGPRVRAASCC